MGKFEFSNFSKLDTPMVIDGVSMPTLEHAFQGLKTKVLAERQKIFSATTPGRAKRAGGKVSLREDWHEIKVDVMRSLLEIKFEKGTSWRKKLDSTKGERLVEWNCWHDNFWGDCECQKCTDIEGQNMLGKLLMEIRT